MGSIPIRVTQQCLQVKGRCGTLATVKVATVKLAIVEGWCAQIRLITGLCRVRFSGLSMAARTNLSAGLTSTGEHKWLQCCRVNTYATPVMGSWCNGSIPGF